MWIGYYGFTGYGNHLIQQPWWTRSSRQRPTWTWGGAGMIAGTNMKQHYGFPSGIDWSSVGVTVDESRVEAGMVMHRAGIDPPPTPTPGAADMPTVIDVPNVASFVSPSLATALGGKGHSHVSWIESSDERANLLKFWPLETITKEQLAGIRLIGDAPASLKALMHQGQGNLVIPPPIPGPPGQMVDHTHSGPATGGVIR
jgi:hypothetical protein